MSLLEPYLKTTSYLLALLLAVFLVREKNERTQELFLERILNNTLATGNTIVEDQHQSAECINSE